MNAVQSRKERYGLSFILGAALLSIFPFPLGTYAATTPTPKISATPASVNFSTVKVGGSSLKPVTIKNTGSANLVVGAITFTGTDASKFNQTNDCSAPLLPNGTCTVSVTFAPTVPYGNKSATLNIASNDPKKPAALVKLSGQASPPVISASPMSGNFTVTGLNIASSVTTVTIKNTGKSDLNISSVTITGPNASLFAVTDTWESPLPSNESCTVGVIFTPDSTGTKSASLQIASDDPKKPLVTVKLTGKTTTTKTSTTYAAGDLAGTWTGSLLETGAGTQVWARMTFTIAADGSYTGTSVRSNGDTGTPSGTFSITSVGKITDLKDEPHLQCNMDAGKTVFSCTDTPKSGITQLGVFTKKDESYALTDLEGTWNGNFVGAGAGKDRWIRATMAVAADGSFTGTSVDSTGNTGAPSGNFSITSDGILTWSGDPNFLCSMDAGKTVIACTDTPDPGNVDVAIFTKSGATYTVADLAGTWSLNVLATGPSAPDWIRATLTVKSDGTFKVSETDYDGTTNKTTTNTGSGNFLLSADGLKISLGKNSNILCQLDSNETAMVCTETWSDGSTALDVLTKGLK